MLLTMSVYERSRKKSQLDTIWYEISMLGFCHSELTTRAKMEEPERNLFIEGFLLHYRNLIQFFSGNPQKHRAADLSTGTPEVWCGRPLTAKETAEIQTPARALEDRYWTDISQFLQHCTERRFVELREWDLDEMFGNLDPIISAFHKSFPQQAEALKPESVLLSTDAASTATVVKSGLALGEWTFKKLNQG